MQLSPPSLQEGAVRDAAASALAGAQPPPAAAVRAQPLRAWARVRSPEALQRPLPAPGVVVARGGWLGRVRQWVQKLSVTRSRVVQDQGAQRQAAVLLRPAPPGVQGTGVRWLRGMGLLSQRLQASVQRMRHHALAPLAAAARPVSAAATAAAASSAASTTSTASATSSASAATPASTPDADADSRALAAVSAAVQQRLAAQAADKDGFSAALHQAFGDKFDSARAETLRQQALAGDFSWVPKVQVVSSQALADLSGTQAAGAAQGAYVQDSDTIYLSRELLHTDSAQAQRILMEEIGHGIDARINTSDAVGDEGEIFSKLMHGDKIGAAELAALQADNDHGMVSLNGRQVAVEYGWFKKLFKAVFGGIAKVVKAVVNGVVGLAKAAVNITIGVATFDLDRIKRGVKDGVNAVVTTVKTVAKAVVDTAKAVAKIAKEAFVKLMQSKLFATVLMICRFIPIPVVQLVVRIVDVVRAAYMVYQGVKNKSLSMVLGGVASLAGGAAKIAGSFGASLSTVQNITDVANAASKLSMAYNAVANKDLGSALGLLGGTLGGPNANPNLNTLVTAAGYVQQAVGIAQAVRQGDGLGALSGTLGLGASTLDEGSALRQDLAQAKEVVTGLQAAREIGRGNLDAAQSLAMGMDHAQQAGQQADAISAQQRQAQADAANRSALNEADKDLRSQAATQDDAGVADATDAADAANGTEATSAAGAGDSSGTEAAAAGSAARPSLTLQVARGQTLEGIARAHYGENWRAGLSQMVMDNGLKLNQWGSPILRAGDTLTLGDLSERSAQDLQAMARAGGKLVAANSSGLQVKADLEERARQAAAQKAMEAQRMSIQGAAAASEESFAGGGWFNAPAPASANGLDMRYQSRAAAQGVETLYRGMSFQDFVKAQANQGGFEPFGRTGYMSPNLDYIKGLEAGTSNPLLDLSVKVRYDMSAEAVRDIRSQAFTENRPAFESFPDNPKLKDRGSLAIEDVFTLKGETVTGVPRSGAAANKPVVELATEGSRVFNLGVGRNVAEPLKETTFRWTVVESSNPAVEAGTTGLGARYASPAELRLQSGLGTVGKGLTVVAAGVDAYRMGEALGTGNKEVITQTGVSIAGGWTGALVMGKVGAESFAAAGCLTPLAAIPFVCAASPFVGGVVGGVLGYNGGSSSATWLLNKAKGR